MMKAYTGGGSAAGGGSAIVVIKAERHSNSEAPANGTSGLLVERILSSCIPAEELQACPLYFQVLEKESEIVGLISRVEIKSLQDIDKMKVLMGGILHCVGEKTKFNMKPNTATVEFKIMETLILNIFLHSAWYDLRSISVSEFRAKYPKLAGLQTSDKAEDRKEFDTLLKFRNVLCVATLLVPANNNKERLIMLATRIVEGLKPDGTPVRYINGSGKTPATQVRHDIFDQEKLSNFESNNEGAYDARLSVVKSLKRKYDIPDPEGPEQRKRGRPKGSRNRHGASGLSDMWSSLLDSNGGGSDDFSLDRVKEEPVEKRAAFHFPAAVYIKEESQVNSYFQQPFNHNVQQQQQHFQFPVVSCGYVTDLVSQPNSRCSSEFNTDSSVASFFVVPGDFSFDHRYAFGPSDLHHMQQQQQQPLQTATRDNSLALSLTEDDCELLQGIRFEHDNDVNYETVFDQSTIADQLGSFELFPSSILGSPLINYDN